ncbi:hypothetical protein BOTCAL_0128g00210 [Botryotinia calthae]|uniref:Uncharacterized protein n=1 Tax=Botryotinia calthae TaxID=38488 RepID=A0A4Y8D4J3_9HELO|nr:hypothetical protein BOTCAL_0128g00210 [Botryotinia calthae]
MADPFPLKVLDQMEIDALSDTATLDFSTTDFTSSDSTSSSSENSSPTNVAAAAIPQSTSNWDEILAAYQASRDREYHYNTIPILDLLRHLSERGIQSSYRDALVAMALIDDENRSLAHQNFLFMPGTPHCFVAEHSNLDYEEDYTDSEAGDVPTGHHAQVDDDQSGNDQVEHADTMDVEQPEVSSDNSTQYHEAVEEL